MGITLTQASGAIWIDNYALTHTLTSSTTGSVAVKANYPLSNLQDARRSAEARYTWDNSGSLNLYFHSSDKVAVTGVALVDSNLNDITNTPTPPLTLYASDGAAPGSGVPGSNFYAWNLYPYESENGVMRWYPNLTHGQASTTNGTPFSSDLGANGANCWTLSFSGNYGSFDELRIGAVVLSVVEPLTIATGATMQVVDPTQYAQAYDGTTYADIQPSFVRLSMSLSPISSSAWYPLAKRLRSHGPRQQVLDLHGYAASENGGQTVTTVDKSASYYGRLAQGSIANVSLSSQVQTDVSVSFDEARG